MIWWLSLQSGSDVESGILPISIQAEDHSITEWQQHVKWLTQTCQRLVNSWSQPASLIRKLSHVNAKIELLRDCTFEAVDKSTECWILYNVSSWRIAERFRSSTTNTSVSSILFSWWQFMDRKWSDTAAVFFIWPWNSKRESYCPNTLCSKFSKQCKDQTSILNTRNNQHWRYVFWLVLL